METQVVILGQGLCGTWLSYFLQQANIPFLVIDQPQAFQSSRVASGVINPVTGRKLHKTWMAETLLPFANKHYQELATQLNIEAIFPTRIRNFFPNSEMRAAYQEAQEKNSDWVKPIDQGAEFTELLRFDWGVGDIQPAYRIRLLALLENWRKHLKQKGLLLEMMIDYNDIQTNRQQPYAEIAGIRCQHLIFTDGYWGAFNPWFSRLPFAPNKGEALLLHIPDLPQNMIYKKGITLVPWDSPEIFWAGSNYQLRFDSPQITDSFKEQTSLQLKSWLKCPFTIIDHWSGIRPATVERRPFVGIHPHYPALGTLNGMGTKGCSLAPYFAYQLKEHLQHGTPIDPAASIGRFQKVLSV